MLAVPAFGALVAEPLFLAVDTALVGHLGAEELAGLGVAGAILHAVVGLMVFLSYSVTPLVARRLGAGDRRGAFAAGIDGFWLSATLGVFVSLVTALTAPWLVRFFVSAAGSPAGGGDGGGGFPVSAGMPVAAGEVSRHALDYLLISTLGIPPMLAVFACVGLLRGLQDTRTPLVIATAGFTLNAFLNWWFIYGLRLGVAGSAWGTVAAQWVMLASYLILVRRATRGTPALWRPRLRGLGRAGRTGFWLFLRTLSLRAVFLVTLAGAAGAGTAGLASFQLVLTVLSVAAFALDAFAIAAQTLVGEALGGGDAVRARQILARVLWQAVLAGGVCALILFAVSPLLGRVFTGDADVLALIPAAFLVLAVGLPIAAVAYVLDGVLMGAGDVRFLALAGAVVFLLYVPVVWLVGTVFVDAQSRLMALTVCIAIVFMLLRVVFLGLRVRRDGWQRLGV